MRHHPGFVAAVLEGIEGTLDELIERSDDSPETRAGLDALQDKVVALRTSLEREVEEPEVEDANAEAVCARTRIPEAPQENMR